MLLKMWYNYISVVAHAARQCWLAEHG